jgi:hypothetical protein
MRYGAYAARRGDLARAESCLRESVALDSMNIAALLALGCVLHASAQPGAASTVLAAASTLAAGSPEAPVAWALRRLVCLANEVRLVSAISLRVGLQIHTYTPDKNVSRMCWGPIRALRSFFRSQPRASMLV